MSEQQQDERKAVRQAAEAFVNATMRTVTADVEARAARRELERAMMAFYDALDAALGPRRD